MDMNKVEVHPADLPEPTLPEHQMETSAPEDGFEPSTMGQPPEIQEQDTFDASPGQQDDTHETTEEFDQEPVVLGVVQSLEGLNLRTGPCGCYPSKAILTHLEQVEILPVPQEVALSLSPWVLVQSDRGIGWVNSEFLRGESLN